MSASSDDDWSSSRQSEIKELEEDLLEASEEVTTFVSPVDFYQSGRKEDVENHLWQSFGFSLMECVRTNGPPLSAPALEQTFYFYCALVNYLRHKKAVGHFAGMTTEEVQLFLHGIRPTDAFWTDEKYLIPFMADDGLLRCALLDDNVSDEAEDGDVSDRDGGPLQYDSLASVTKDVTIQDSKDVTIQDSTTQDRIVGRIIAEPIPSKEYLAQQARIIANFDHQSPIF